MDTVAAIRISAQVAIKGREGVVVDEATAPWFDGAAADLGLATATALEVAGLGIRGGRVQLSYDPRAGHFWALAEYESPARLGDTELEYLKEETYGDWHDGVGGSFFEYLGQSLGVAVTVSIRGSLQVEQQPAVAARLGPWSALVQACWRRELENVRELLDRGEDSNARADGLPALQGAIACGASEVALLLIERGVDVRARDLLEERRDALRSCATSIRLGDWGAATVARALLERGAVPIPGGDPPLAIAKRRKWERLVQVLEEFAGTARA